MSGPTYTNLLLSLPWQEPPELDLDPDDQLRRHVAAELRPFRGTRWFRNWQWGVMLETSRPALVVLDQSVEKLSLRQLDEPSWHPTSHSQFMRDCIWPAPRALAALDRFHACLAGGNWVDRRDDSTADARLRELLERERWVAALVLDDPDVPG